MYNETLLTPGKREKVFRYTLFGLSIASSEPAPGLCEDVAPAHGEELKIRFGTAPEALAHFDYSDATVQANQGEYLFSMPGIVRLYYGAAGELVVTCASPDNTAPAWPFILGVGLSNAGFRRGLIPLHASAVVVGENLMAFAGQTGAGKSTLAASLSGFGYELFADDLCLMQPRGPLPPLVGAGLPELRLCDDAVSALGWQDRRCDAMTPDRTKSVYRLDQKTDRALPLTRIYALSFATDATPAGIYRQRGLSAMQALVDGLRLRPGLLTIGAKEQIFSTLASLSTAIELYRFVRPRDHDQSMEWTEQLVAHMHTGGGVDHA